MLRLLVAQVAMMFLLTASGLATEANDLVSEDPTNPAPVDLFGDPLPMGAIARLGTIRWRHGGVFYMGYGGDGRAVLSAGHDGTIRLWDAATGKELRRFGQAQPSASDAIMPLRTAATPGFGTIFNVVLSDDRRTLAAVDNSHVIHLWEVETGKELRQIKGPAGGIASLAFSPDSKVLAFKSGDGIRLTEVATGNELNHFRGQSMIFPCIAFSSNGKTVLSVEGAIGTQAIRLLETATGKEVRRFKVNGVSSLLVSPSGRTLACGRPQGIQLFDLATGEELRQLEGHEDGLAAIAFAPDGKTLATRGTGGAIRLWDVDTGFVLRRFDAEGAAPRVDQRLAMGGYNRIAARDLAFSVDGKRLASGNGASTIGLWEVATGQRLAQAEGHNGPNRLGPISQLVSKAKAR